MSEKVVVQRLEMKDYELVDYLETAYENGSELLCLQQLPNEGIHLSDEPIHKYLIVLRDL